MIKSRISLSEPVEGVDGREQDYLGNEYGGSGEIAHESQPRDVFHIPAEVHFFKSHDYYACGRAYDEHAAAYAGAVREQQPEAAVLYEAQAVYLAGSQQVGNLVKRYNLVHTHRSSYKGYIIYDR